MTFKIGNEHEESTVVKKSLAPIWMETFEMRDAGSTDAPLDERGGGADVTFAWLRFVEPRESLPFASRDEGSIVSEMASFFARDGSALEERRGEAPERERRGVAPGERTTRTTSCTASWTTGT